jgi:hypothetical protein
MEQFVRVQNERDRQVLAWLPKEVGDAAVISAANLCPQPHGKPYLSAICRVLKVTPPRYTSARAAQAEVGDRYLESIYTILRRPASANHTRS